jgi:hypothetical protein
MDWLNELGRRLLILSRRGRFDADLEEEMRLHRELREQEQIERGFSPKQAHYVSLSRFGNDLVLREGESGYVGMELAGTPRARHSVWLANVGQKPRIHSRCDLEVAFGIGAYTGVFSVINAVLLRPLPFPHADRLVQIWETDRRRSIPWWRLDTSDDSGQFSVVRKVRPRRMSADGFRGCIRFFFRD